MSSAPPTLQKPTSQLWEMWLAREREFLREPGVLFWVFGFPVLLAVVLGLAFRSKGPEASPILLAEEAGPADGSAAGTSPRAALEKSPLLAVRRVSEDQAEARYKRGDGLVVLHAPRAGPLVIEYDDARSDAVVAKDRVRDALERAAGRADVTEIVERKITAPGRRYIDFLIPGLLGMSLMSGGIWGVGWALVNLRIKRLLKRFVSTPMSRPAFLASFLMHRIVVSVVETAFLVAFGYFAFGVEIRGSLVAIAVVSFAGAASFSGLGLLIACRARNSETANGLMNLASLPMWVLSGVFFSAANFPDWMRPIVGALPLTALNDGLRAIWNDGASLASVAGYLGILAAWGIGTFLLALKWFRWV